VNKHRWSARAKLTMSYLTLVVIAGALLLGVVWIFLLRYVPQEAVWITDTPGGDPFSSPSRFIPGRGDLWEAFWPKAAGVLGALLVVGLVGGWLLASYMLAPLQRITAAARQVSAGSLTHRINLTGRNDEFQELADAFDAMLERISTHIGEQRQFAANASHELRTPLTTTQSMLEVARRDPNRDTDLLLERLYAVNARAITLTQALLTLSRADQRSFTTESVDLSLLAEEAVELLLPLAEEKGVTIETSGQAAFALGSPALLAQVATNLVHNAIVHNLPAYGTVQIHTEFSDKVAVLVIVNTGKVLLPEVVETLIEPFQRGERIHSDHSGVGLGLAIVTSIVHAHGGTLTLTPVRSGGLRVSVTLPSASST